MFKKKICFILLSYLPMLTYAASDPFLERPSKNFSNLYAAISDLDEERLKTLLANGANINEPRTTFYYFTLLHDFSLYENNIEQCKLLLKHGANPNARRSSGVTPLNTAIRNLSCNSSIELVKLLVENGANVDPKDNLENLPLLDAIDSCNEECISYLIDKGANINAKQEDGDPFIHRWTVSDLSYYDENDMLCSGYTDDDITKLSLLLKYGADPNATDNYGVTALHIVSGDIGKRKMEVLKLLVENGANIEATDDHGQTPLFHAVEWSNKKVISYLIGQGANIDTQDNKGKTTLHVAATMPSFKMVKHLLQNGANKNIRDNNGETPLERAKRRRAEAIQNFQAWIEQHPDQVSAPPDNSFETGFDVVIRYLEEE